jgi:acyl-coenzyme A thioesterase PaaI-like protein
MHKTLWPDTLKLWTFGFFKIPLIYWLRPKIIELTEQRAEIKIALKRRTKNHLKSMYFGVLCVGADVAGGIQLMKVLGKDIGKISFVFKDMQAEFLKRPEADVHFICSDGQLVVATIQKALQSHERENVLVHIVATTPTLSGDEPVARFALTLSLKQKAK